MEARNEKEKNTLLIVLGINALMFVFEMASGLIAESTGLIADSLDMFADASIYAISLYAVGKSDIIKMRAARLSGFAQIFLSLIVLADVTRRFLAGSEPTGILIMSTGIIALVANTVCMVLIARHRDGGIHMRASVIFSQNDVIANTGVILSGFLVWIIKNSYPDLVIGIIIAVLVLRGGLKILKEADEDNEYHSVSYSNSCERLPVQFQNDISNCQKIDTSISSSDNKSV